MVEKFLVKTEVFEGPLDLLLSLIEKRKLLINEISLARITDDYISYIESNKNLSINKNAHFILIAATLILIKSKSILPTIDLTREEERGIKDLATRLKIYRKIKDVENCITNLFNNSNCYFRNEVSCDEEIFVPNPKINLDNLKSSIENIIVSLPKEEKLPQKLVKKVISLEETIVSLTTKIQKGINMNFKDFSNIGKEERVNVVVSFLAMLELVKQGMIEVSQNNGFGDIDIQTKSFDTPNYS